MSHPSFTIGKLFPYKDRQSLLYSSGVVYQLICSCGQNYIGQTKRNLITRLNEHRMCEDYEVCKRLLNNPNHEINFDSPKILDRSNHVTKLRIKETLHNSKTEPQLNVDINFCPCIFSMLNCFKLLFKNDVAIRLCFLVCLNQ